MTSKLSTLMEIEGYDDSLAFLEAVSTDSVCPGICVRHGCDYTTEVEPDCRDGYCEECGKQSVKSALILAGIM
jgi:hypothetical protein